MKFDLHLHTRQYSPDSIIAPQELLKRAKAAGLDGVVITEHDILWPADELAALQKHDPSLVVLAGIEVTTREGDVLVYGVSDGTPFARGMSMADCCRAAHAQGGAAVAAHPYRWGQNFDQIMRAHQPELDGLEVMSNNMDAGLRRRAAALLARLRLTGLGNSDGHEPEVVGCCYTDFADPIRDNASLVAAIQSRRATAHERRGGSR
jgi:hypothetical protein